MYTKLKTRMYAGISNLTYRKKSMTTKKMKNQAVLCRGLAFILRVSDIVILLECIFESVNCLAADSTIDIFASERRSSPSNAIYSHEKFKDIKSTILLQMCKKRCHERGGIITLL
jgi:hypothetical protein